MTTLKESAKDVLGMSIARCRAIVRLCLAYMDNQWYDFIEDYAVYCPCSVSVRPNIEVGGGEIVAPSDDEVDTLNAAGIGGNWRTREVLLCVLQHCQYAIEDMGDYLGYTTEAMTHIDVEGKGVREPTEEEFATLIEHISYVAKYFPALNIAPHGWDVYAPGTDDDDDQPILTSAFDSYQLIDTVYYTASTDREYVLRTLIDHDNYPTNIYVVPRTVEHSED